MSLLRKWRAIVEKDAIQIILVVKMLDTHGEQVLRYLLGAVTFPVRPPVSLEEVCAIHEYRRDRHLPLPENI